MIEASITFRKSKKPKKFTLSLANSPWRFLTDSHALVLVPVCDLQAWRVDSPPLADRVRIAFGLNADVRNTHQANLLIEQFLIVSFL